jgi:glycosyltransferase involved in cell wall biosynthesis
MYVVHDEHLIVCITDTKPEGHFVEIQGDPEDIIKEYYVEDGILRKKKSFFDPSKLKIAMVASYGMNCGLATYTKYLCDEMKPMVADLKVFSEVGPSDDTNRCWDRLGNDYSQLLAEIRAYNPDVVYVQHEYGCFNNGARWNTLIGHLNALYRTIVVLHSVYDHVDKLVFEAPCQELIVHSKSSKELLLGRGVDHCEIYTIPHGCLVDEKHYNFRFSQIKSEHVIFQYGFGFEYKGWDQAIDVIDQLRHLFPDVVYIGVFNVSQFAKEFSEEYYKRLMRKVRDRGLTNHFVLHKGFRSEQILMSYMKQANINIFPYWNHPEWLVHGASGAVRLALASGTPTILGDVPFFSEFKGHVPVCTTVDDYVQEISKIFVDPKYRDIVCENTKNFIYHRTWDKIARKYLEVL